MVEMKTTINVTGLVATTPRHLVTQDGLPITSFRLASAYEKLDVNGNPTTITNWYTVSAFKTLAINIASSIHKGERVIVVGELQIRDWDNGERAGTSVEIIASNVGHDLSWGTSTFTRTVLAQ